jgi:hypothetical protein
VCRAVQRVGATVTYVEFWVCWIHPPDKALRKARGSALGFHSLPQAMAWAQRFRKHTYPTPAVFIRANRWQRGALQGHAA